MGFLEAEAEWLRQLERLFIPTGDIVYISREYIGGVWEELSRNNNLAVELKRYLEVERGRHHGLMKLVMFNTHTHDEVNVRYD